MFKLRKLHCSFCGKSETDVAKLVAGPRVYICDSCVTIASRIISDSNGADQPVRVEATIWRKLVDRFAAIVSCKCCQSGQRIGLNFASSSGTFCFISQSCGPSYGRAWTSESETAV